MESISSQLSKLGLVRKCAFCEKMVDVQKGQSDKLLAPVCADCAGKMNQGIRNNEGTKENGQ